MNPKQNKIEKPKQQGVKGSNQNLNMSDQLQDLELQNSFEKGNEVFTLRSQINSLKIQKQKLSLEHEQALKTLQSRNQQLASQLTAKKRQMSTMQITINKLQHENEQLKGIIETHKGNYDANRRTADFHHSIQDNANNLGASDLINQLLEKDRKIKQLMEEISRKQLRASGSLKNVDQGLAQSQKLQKSIQKQHQQQISGLQKIISDLKTKQIAYKKQYQSMLQSKQQLIKKLTIQSQQHNKKSLQSKQKQISHLKTQLQQSLKLHQVSKTQIKNMQQKCNNLQSSIMKLSNQFMKKQQQIISISDAEKQQISRSMLEKLRALQKEKEEKIYRVQERVYELENEMLMLKQDNSKMKTQNNSLVQINKYLEESVKELEANKNRVHAMLIDKEKEIGQLRENYFKEVADLKKSNADDKNSYENKILKLQEQLIAKKYMSQKFQRLLQQKSSKQQSTNLKQQYVLLDEIQNLRTQKSQLSQQLLSLEQRYKQKNQKLYSLQKQIRQQYQTRIKNLQTELLSQRSKINQEKQQIIASNQENKQSLQAKYSKLQMVCQLLEIDKNQKMAEIRKMADSKISMEAQINGLKEKVSSGELKISEMKQDYRTLQILHQQLNDKYKRGVKDLQIQIQQMTTKIQEQRKKAERRKSQNTQLQQSLQTQLQQQKQHIVNLQQQLDQHRTRKIQQSHQASQKMHKLSSQLSCIVAQNQSLSNLCKNQERVIREHEAMYEQQKGKLMEYIHQLEENSSILATKLSIQLNKQASNLANLEKMDRELKNVKVQYSVSLQEINQLLNKCKQLQEVSKQSIAHMEAMRQKYQVLYHQYGQIKQDRERIGDQLGNAYEQVNRLNKVLMTKQQQLSRWKTQQQQKQIITQTVHYLPTPVTYYQSPVMPRVVSPLAPPQVPSVMASMGPFSSVQQLPQNSRIVTTRSKSPTSAYTYTVNQPIVPVGHMHPSLVGKSQVVGKGATGYSSKNRDQDKDKDKEKQRYQKGNDGGYRERGVERNTDQDVLTTIC